MKRTMFMVVIGIVIPFLLASGQQIYRWTDEKGTIHFTDDPTLVPEKFRGQIKEKELPLKPASPPASVVPKQVPPQEAPVEHEPKTPPGQKDLLGRGEDWWRTKAKEWNGRLLNAQKNYESAYAAWKNKEKELAQSTFKPESLKRKLRAEVQALEGKTKDWEKQIAEAKNMIENVLPREAKAYRADPDWLTIER